MRTLLLLGLLLTFLVSPGWASDEETVSEESVAEGPHFRVVLHFEGGGLEQTALAQVEALWGTAASIYGLPKGPRPGKKLEVHLYRDSTDYEVAEEKLTGGAFRKNLAFAHFDSGTAHVALQPFLSDETLARVGLPLLTRSLLLHEAAHLIRYQALPNFRDHPAWFRDGIAMWLKNRVLVDEGLSLGTELEPTSSTGVVRMQRALEEGRLPTVAAILAPQLKGLGFSERYSACWLFFRFLMEAYPKKMRAYIRKARRLGGGKAFASRMAGLLARQLGERRFTSLDPDFREFVGSLKPAWEESLRSLQGGEKQRVQIAFPQSNAVAWVSQPVARTQYVVAGTAEILPNVNQQMNILLDRSEAGFICVSLVADYGVTLFEYTSKDRNWRRCASVRCGEIVLGKPFAVRVQVEGKKLTVVVAGETIVQHEFPQRRMSGPWGLGARAGSAGIWKAFGLR